MKKHWCFKLSIFLVLMIGNVQLVTSQEKEEKILLKSIENFNLAFKKGDVEKLESMITDQYVHTNGNSKSIDKNTWITYLYKRKKEIENKDLIVNSYEMRETEIQLHNNTAIVTGKIVVSNTKNDELIENQYRVTNIWVYKNNQWKRAAFHDGKIK